MECEDITKERFREVSGLWATGVSIITTVDLQGQPYGLTMNSVTSLSLEPPMFLVCVDSLSDTLNPLLESKVFCINILSKTQQGLSNTFAKKGDNKFEDLIWSSGKTKAPIIDGSVVYIECEVDKVYEGGDHKIICGRTVFMKKNEDSLKPLVYFMGKYRDIV